MEVLNGMAVFWLICGNRT